MRSDLRGKKRRKLRFSHGIFIIGWLNVSAQIRKALYALRSGLMQEAFECQTCICRGGDKEGGHKLAQGIEMMGRHHWLV
jgi:hypothetical protein